MRKIFLILALCSLWSLASNGQVNQNFYRFLRIYQTSSSAQKLQIRQPNANIWSDIGGSGGGGSTYTAGTDISIATTTINNTSTLQSVLGRGATKTTAITDNNTGSSVVTNYWQPNNYGTSYGARGYAERYGSGYELFTGVNASGRPNVVATWLGYNVTPGGSPINPAEANIRFSLEQHYEMLGSDYFEVHLGETGAWGGGAKVRPFSMYINKRWPKNNYSLLTQRSFAIDIDGTNSYFSTEADSAGYFRTNIVSPTLSAGLYIQGAAGSNTTNINAANVLSQLRFSNFASYNWDGVLTYTPSVNRFTKTYIQDSIGVWGQGNKSGIYFGSNTQKTAYIEVDNGSGEVKHWVNSGGWFPTFYSNGGEAARIATTKNLLIGTTTDVSTSLVTMASTSKGFLAPRMTKAQRDAISSPAQGLLVFVTDGAGYLSWYNSGWQKISSVAD